MKRAFQLIGLMLLMVVAMVGCSATGSTTTPVATTTAQEVGQDQGTAQATETGSAINNNYPQNYNFFGAKSVTVTTSKTGETSVAMEGQPDANVTVGNAHFGAQTLGDDSMQAEVSSGGGAAGGVGSVSRQADNTRNRAGGNQATGTTGGGNQ